MSYPTSSDKKIQKMTDILVRYSDLNGFNYSFGGSELYPVEAFSDFGGLSLFLNESRELFQKLYSKNYSYKELMESIGRRNIILTQSQIQKESSYLDSIKTKEFPVNFLEKEEGTFFGFSPIFSDTNNGEFNIIAHLTFYSLEECIKKAKEKKIENNAIPLDDLYEKMVLDISNKKLILTKGVSHTLHVQNSPNN